MDHRRRRARRIRLGMTALGGCLIAATAQIATHGPAQAAGAYGATANAAGFLSTTQDPQHFPVGAVIEGDGPISQAALSSTGQSTGFASFPYPGAFFLSLQGLAASQGAPETPAYPLYVASDASIKPKDELKQPGLTLTSQSSPDASSSQAAAGGNSEQASVGSAVARTNVSADKSAGTVLSEASADTQVLSAGPLRIGRILSAAQATHSSSGGLKRSSSLELFGVTVNGVTYGFTDKGFSSGASNSPLPANPAAEQLAKAGITVTYLAAKEVPDGVLSPGLRIQIDHEQTDLHTVIVVGQALAVASGDAAAAAPGLLGGGLLGGGFNGGSFGGTTSGSPSGTGSASGSPAAGSTVSAGGGAGYPSGASAGGTSPSTSSGTSSAPAPATGTPLSARPVAVGSAPGTSFYLLLVVGAVGALVVGQLISLVGVRWAR
ncbi:MAG TPA: hypothetical protein VMU20_17535 [Candidatus Dormibacteraeota bacterium]|nr:hypothetical protein [Candidatus Dormibacteraeota bacterium]